MRTCAGVTRYELSQLLPVDQNMGRLMWARRTSCIMAPPYLIKKVTNLGYGFNVQFSRNGKVSAFGMKEISPSNSWIKKFGTLPIIRLDNRQGTVRCARI
jgi:hypothetical protein